MLRFTYYCALLLLLWSVGLWATPQESVMTAEEMHQKKAKIIYNLSRFTYWPEEILSTFHICLLGADNPPLAHALTHLSQDKLIHGQRVQVQHLPNRATLATENCHVALLGGDVSITDALPLLQRRPILSISDTPDFARQGGIIELIQTNQRVRFSINLNAAENVGLSFNAQLLMMSTTLPLLKKVSE
jgi:hypothetical protein